MEVGGEREPDGDRTIYDICGEEYFVRLVDAFYDGVERDPVLIPLYPEGSDTIGARRRLAMFLAQYWGGPDTYMAERGHPRLRMRHQPYVITHVERDRWLMHMANAIETTMDTIDAQYRDVVVDRIAEYMVNAADHLRNA